MGNGLVIHKNCGGYIFLYVHNEKLIFLCASCKTNWSASHGVSFNLAEDMEVVDG